MPLLSFSRSLPKRLARLKAIPLFSTLDRRELRIVDDLVHDRDYLDGEIVFDAGEEGQAIYLVFEGKVLVSRQGQPESGFIAELGAGSFVGEQSLLDHSPRTAQVRAVGPCKMGVLFRTDFQNLLEADARVASKVTLQLARYLSRRLRKTVLGQPYDGDDL